MTTRSIPCRVNQWFICVKRFHCLTFCTETTARRQARNFVCCIAGKAHNTDKKNESNLHYTRGITRKHETGGGAHLRGLAPGLHSSEETSQRWRAIGDTVPIWPTRKSNPRPPAPTACTLSNWANGMSIGGPGPPGSPLAPALLGGGFSKIDHFSILGGLNWLALGIFHFHENIGEDAAKLLGGYIPSLPPGFAPMLIEFYEKQILRFKEFGKSRDKSYPTDQKTSSILVVTNSRSVGPLVIK